MINICGSVCIPGAKHGMLGLIPQTLFFLERASANTGGGSGYPRLSAARALPARFTCHCYPPKSIWLARRKGLQLLSSFLYYFSLSYLDRLSMGAEVGRFKRFVFFF